MRKISTTLSVICLLMLCACGGGGSTSRQTATGYFIDSPVSGLSYTSGGQSGVTGEDGSFLYEVDQPVTFFLGKMVLGTIKIDKNNRIFPVDLVSGARDETHANVSLMARVLQTLDSNNDPTDGITIDDTARQAINEVIQLASVDPAAALARIQVALGNTRPLVDSNTAQTHIRANLLKEYAGTWQGRYSGGDQGPCTVTISKTGSISGNCTSEIHNLTFPITGSLNSDGSSAAGNTETGANFTGTYQRYGEVSGDWVNQKVDIRGTFTLKRQGS
ncbi:hypothetical protein ACHEXK_05200 [Limnohabitans sp. DCL3]|uniref:hypothetical protein n=1 Tax=Limnohabitans sp. DCL3 TaxID=3374103 RepID=UPI003A8B9E26